jgi:hypothetical protein
MGLTVKLINLKKETLQRAMNRTKKDDELILITSDNKAIKLEGKIIIYNDVPVNTLKALAKATD